MKDHIKLVVFDSNCKCANPRFHARAIWNIYQIVFLTPMAFNCFRIVKYVLEALFSWNCAFPEIKNFFHQIWDIFIKFETKEKKYKYLKRISKIKLGSFWERLLILVTFNSSLSQLNNSLWKQGHAVSFARKKCYEVGWDQFGKVLQRSINAWNLMA